MKIKKEDYFTPRIINPVKIAHVLIFSADEQIQKAEKKLREDLPWIKVHMISNPQAAADFKSDEPVVLICDDTALNLIDTKPLKRRNPDVIVILMSAVELIHCSHISVTIEKYPYAAKADMIFATNRRNCAPAKILTSLVRCAEDQLNIEKYSQARRYIFLVVEDEPRWISQFLPVLYDIIGQRAAIKVTRSYEETLDFLFGEERESKIDQENFKTRGHGDDVVCLITDMYFPRRKNMQHEAGTDLIHLIDQYYPRFPKIIASKASKADDLRSTAFLVPKGDPESLQTLKNYIHDYTGMGDFVISDEKGRILYRAKNIQDMLQVMKKAEKDTQTGKKLRSILRYYGKRDDFSTWLYMHGFKNLADKILPRQTKGRRLVTSLRKLFEKEIEKIKITPLKIGENEIYSLEEFLQTLHSIHPEKIQKLTDNDVFSTWLDRKGYPELADEIRPIHGSGRKLEKALTKKVEKWVKIYNQRNQSRSKKLSPA